MNAACTAVSTLTTEYSERDILSFLIQSDIIKLNDVETAMKQAESKKLLEQHPYAITQGKDGRYRTYIKTDNGRKQIAKSTLEKLNKALFEHYKSNSENAKKQTMTLAGIYPLWLKYKSLHTSAQNYIDRINRDWKKYYLGTDIINIPIKHLSKVILDEWAHSLIKHHDMSKNQYFNCTVIMRQALSYAVDLGIIESNPFELVKVDGRRMFRKTKKKESSTQVYSKKELEQIVALAWADFNNDAMYVHKLAPLAVIFQFQTGIRIGELCALRYEDIHTSFTKLHIQRMFRFETGEVVDHTKGSFGDREVFLTSTAKLIINVAKEKQQVLGVSSTGYIFSVNDKPLPYKAVESLHIKYSKAICGIQKSSHKSRKTYISTLLDSNVNLNTVREAVGHCDEKTTLNCYYFDRNTEEEKIAQFEEALVQKCNQV